MRSAILSAACLSVLAGIAPLAHGQSILVLAEAFANMPDHTLDQGVYVGPTWAAAGYHTTREARAQKDEWDPPYTESFAHAEFNQSQPDDAILRAYGVARQPYRGRYHNPDSAKSEFQLSYELQIANLSGSPLNIVLSNEMHGTFSTAASGSMTCEEGVFIHGPGYFFHASSDVHLDNTGMTATGLWTNSVIPETVHDELYQDLAGYRLSAFEFYPSVAFAPHSAQTFTCEMFYNFFAELGPDASGLARYDFGNTAYLRVQAYDPDTGADRSAEIGVVVVVTPVCGTSDFNGDGDVGTDADIEAFFACLGGNCCATCFPGGADFNGDGDVGTDSDIEAFFRVLAGGPC